MLCGWRIPLASPWLTSVRQTAKGCFQTFCGCDANEEYKISNRAQQGLEFLYVLEDTSCLCRFCLHGQREMTLNLSVGNQPGGAPVARFYRPFKCSAYVFVRLQFWIVLEFLML
jgi:hypothetical protein